MAWVIGGIVVLVVLVLGGAVWFGAPTLRTFLRPGFEPAPKDDESVFLAQQNTMVDGGE